MATKHSKTRVQAIWTLAGLAGLDEPTLLAGLEDPDPRVREAVIPAASRLTPHSRLVADAVIRQTEDADAHVRFQAALALGDDDDRAAGLALARLARRDGNDPWMRAAILSSACPHVDTLLLAVCRDSAGGQGTTAPPAAIIEPLMRLAVALKDPALFDGLTRTIAQPAGQGGRFAPWQFSALAGLLDARDRTGVTANVDFEKPFAAVWSAARRVVDDESAPEPERIGAAQLIGYGARSNVNDRDHLIGLLRPQVSPALQQAAVAALGATREPKLADVLLVGWKAYSPAIRDAILDAVLSRTEWTSSLLSSLEDGCVPPAEIGPARRQQLLTRRSPQLRARAETLFAHQNMTRQAVIDAYRPALADGGDKLAGAVVFKKLCASCHRLGNEGVEVGPDLAALTDKSPENLLIAILDPNRAFEAKFANFSIATDDGRVYGGLIATESATAVTLRRADGKEDVLLRTQIAEMTASGQSLMPEGLEKDLKPRDLADLIAFLTAPGTSRTSK